MRNLKKLFYLSLGVFSFSSPVNAVEHLHKHYPDALICIHNQNGDIFERIYTLTITSDVALRYDGPNPSELIHFNPETGKIIYYSTAPSYVDCVSRNMSIDELIEENRGLEIYRSTLIDPVSLN